MDVNSSQQSLSFGFLSMYPHKNDSPQFFFFPEQQYLSTFTPSGCYCCCCCCLWLLWRSPNDLLRFSFLRFTLHSIPLHAGVPFFRWAVFDSPPPAPNTTVAVATTFWAYPLNKLDQTLEAIVLSTSTLNTYPNSSLSSFLVASKGTFRTSILELFCFVVVADLRCDTLSLKMKWNKQKC